MSTGPIETILATLVAAKVRFVVVGGVAVVLQGYPRFTVDLDLLLGFESANIRAAMRAFEALGFAPKAPVTAAGFADPDIRKSWLEDKGLMVFSLWSDSFRGTDIDLLVSEPIPFAELEAAATQIALETTTVPVASIRHLLRMKEAAGRPGDLEDARALRGLLAQMEPPLTPERKSRESAAWETHRREQERDWARMPAAVRLRALEEMKRFAEQAQKKNATPQRSPRLDSRPDF